MTLAAQVAALPGRSAQRVRQLNVRLVQPEATKTVYPEPGGADTTAKEEDEQSLLRQVQRVRASDITAVPIVRNAGEWEAFAGTSSTGTCGHCWSKGTTWS